MIFDWLADMINFETAQNKKDSQALRKKTLLILSNV